MARTKKIEGTQFSRELAVMNDLLLSADREFAARRAMMVNDIHKKMTEAKALFISDASEYQKFVDENERISSINLAGGVTAGRPEPVFELPSVEPLALSSGKPAKEKNSVNTGTRGRPQTKESKKVEEAILAGLSDGQWHSKVEIVESQDIPEKDYKFINPLLRKLKGDKIENNGKIGINCRWRIK